MEEACSLSSFTRLSPHSALFATLEVSLFITGSDARPTSNVSSSKLVVWLRVLDAVSPILLLFPIYCTKPDELRSYRLPFFSITQTSAVRILTHFQNLILCQVSIWIQLSGNTRLTLIRNVFFHIKIRSYCSYAIFTIPTSRNLYNETFNLFYMTNIFQRKYIYTYTSYIIYKLLCQEPNKLRLTPFKCHDTKYSFPLSYFSLKLIIILSYKF